ncbi:MAG: dTDP-4-dehydrorhamnose reductase [Fimbriimonas sp.]
MKLLLVGGTGMLGTDLAVAARRAGHEVFAPSRAELDITDPSAVARLASGEVNAEVCVNCAAYTAVDLAETNGQAAFELNALGPGYLAQACSLAGIRLIHVSTDFVFDGTKDGPYTEDDKTNPLGVYGETKRQGEERVLASGGTVVRTSWLYGPNGKSFPRTMIQAWRAGRDLRVVSDQVGCPTYTGDLADALLALVGISDLTGLIHLTGSEAMSWHAFSVATLKAYKDFSGFEREVEVAPILSADWPTPARRPSNSVLDCSRAEGLDIKMPRLQPGLDDFIRRLSLT